MALSDTQLPLVGIEQGGATFYVKSGGVVRVDSGGDITMNGVSLARKEYALDIADLSAEAAYYIPMPLGGTVKRISSSIDGAVSTADVTITASIAGVDVTGGVLTIATASSAAGDYDSVSPSAANVVPAGGVLKLLVTGGGSGGSPRGHVVVEVE